MRKLIVLYRQDDSYRAALMEGGLLTEYHIELPDDREGAGSIYKGRVVNVLPGMQAAFVDIGQKRNAFLYVDDLLPAHLEKQPAVRPPIAELVKPGQELLVQVKKEAQGSKGARVTTHFSLPGRWIVFMPGAGYTAVSHKIVSEAERSRLIAAADSVRTCDDGIIVRTAAEGKSEQAIVRDLEELRDTWARVSERAVDSPAPALLYTDLGLIPRVLRDMLTEDVDEMITEDRKLREECVKALAKIDSGFTGRVRIWDGAVPLERHFGVDTELRTLFRRKIPLHCGGHLVVDLTEALTIIDVNTGSFTGSVDLEETAFAVNLEAAALIARLIRLRNWGGIILIDFIDMELPEHRQAVLDEMNREVKKDRNKTTVIGWTKLGLLEVTRKKIRQNLDERFFDVCSICMGRGTVASVHHPSATKYGTGQQ